MDKDRWMTAAEVAALFNVTPRTIVRWAEKGRIPFERTLGGNRRYPRDGVEAVLKAEHGIEEDT